MHITNPYNAARQSKPLYVGVPNHATIQAELFANADPQASAAMAWLGSVPTARWFTGADPDIASTVQDYVQAAAQRKAIPVLVAYNIPQRDGGSHSSGGAASPEAYLNWIAAFASSIGRHSAMVILEPDTLAQIDQLTPPDQHTRYQLLRAAVDMLSRTGARTYLDAGNPAWHSPRVMARRLERAKVAATAGFSLNVANFYTTADCATYGSAISALTHGKHFVIDTSRNGNGPSPTAEWCNPSGRALGKLPTLQTSNPLIDAYLWVKVPGASDGPAGEPVSGTLPPTAGVWWPEYALDLMQNTSEAARPTPPYAIPA